MPDPTKNSQLVFERLPALVGAPNQRINVVINNDNTFSIYIEDRANSDFQSNADAITATGLPLKAGSTPGGVTGSGITNQLTKWTNGPGSVLGDSSISDTGAIVTITNPSLVLVGTTITFPDGIRQTFNPDATTPGLNVGSNAGDPSTPANGDIWYDSTGNLLRARINGTTRSLGAGIPGGVDTNVQFNDGGTFGGDAGMTYNKTTDALTVVGQIQGGSMTSPGAGTASERFGSGASTGSLNNSVAVGNNAVAGASGTGDNTLVGTNTSTFGTGSTAIGFNARANADSTTAIGQNALVSRAEGIVITSNVGEIGSNSIGSIVISYQGKAQGGGVENLIGDNVWTLNDSTITRVTGIGGGMSIGHRDALVLGNGSDTTHAVSTTTGPNQAIFGLRPTAIGSPDTGGLFHYFFGQGVSGPFSPDIDFNVTAGSGNNIAGGHFTIRPGQPTGNATGGSFIVATAPPGSSGSTPGTFVNRLVIPSSGDVVINSPSQITSWQNSTTSQILQIHETFTDASNRDYLQLNMFSGVVRITNFRRATGNNRGGDIKIITDNFAESTNTWQFDYVNNSSNHTRLIPLENNGQDLGGANNRIKNFYVGTGILLGTTLTFSGTAPTISAGFGTTPSISGSATCFTITVGTGGTDSTGTIGLPTASNGWVVYVQDVTNPDSFITSQTGGTASTATVRNYSRTTGLAIAWTAGDVLRCIAVAY